MPHTLLKSPDEKKLKRLESGFKKLLMGSAIFVFLVLVGICVTLLIESWPSLAKFGIGFLWGETWDPAFSEFGAKPFWLGTLLTSILAVGLSVPVSLALSIFMGEYHTEGKVAGLLRSMIELLAGIPSVIYGFWGLFVLVPIIRQVQQAFHISPYGVGIFTAALILAIMIIPYSASIGRDIISLVPNELKEAALSLGATRYEMVKTVIIPYAKSGLFSGIILSFGRAIGETMAVTMVIGNSNLIPNSLFSPGNTMASVIANEFAEASEKLYVSGLVEIALILFVGTTIFSYLGRKLINKWTIRV